MRWANVSNLSLTHAKRELNLFDLVDLFVQINIFQNAEELQWHYDPIRQRGWDDPAQERMVYKVHKFQAEIRQRRQRSSRHSFKIIITILMVCYKIDQMDLYVLQQGVFF